MPLGSNPDLMREMAEVEERLGDQEAALELVQRALSYRRTDYELRTLAGDLGAKVQKRRIAKADKDGDRALASALEAELLAFEAKDLGERVELRPGDAALRLQYARRLVRAASLDEALAQLQRIQADPRVGGEAVFLLARCFHEKGILDLAAKEYERALAAQPSGSDRAKEVLYHLGSIAEAQGKAEEARSWFLRIYAVDIGYRDVAAKMKPH